MQRIDEDKAKKEQENLLRKLNVPKNKHADNVRVYAASAYFTPEQLKSTAKTHAGSLLRTLTKVMGIVTMGDQLYYSQDRTISSQGKRRDLKNVADGDPELLSPQERMLARKKIIISESLAFKKGGYPRGDATELAKPHAVLISTRAAPQFEMDYLEYRHFIVDPIRNAQVVSDPVFMSRYQQNQMIPSHQAVQQLLGNENETKDWLRLKVGDQYLVRTEKGYALSNNQHAALILNKKALLQSLKEDILLELTAQNDMLGEMNQRDKMAKQGLFKATLSGLGFFAKIDNQYSITPQLMPLFFQAYADVLKTHTFSNIAVIEFPTFEPKSEEAFKAAFDNNQPKAITVQPKKRDVLDFTEEEQAKYHCAVSNPGDCFSLPGNEESYASVEAAIGNNTTLRRDQVYLTNSAVANPKQWRGVSFQAADVVITPIEKTEQRLHQEAALLQALQTGNVSDLNAAINMGANINWQIEAHGGTLLSLAAIEGKTALVAELLKRGVQMDIKDHQGNTALAWAILHGQHKTAQLLIERGANYLSQDLRGETPKNHIEVQKAAGKQAFVDLYQILEKKEWGAKIDNLQEKRLKYEMLMIEANQGNRAQQISVVQGGLTSWIRKELEGMISNKTETKEMILYKTGLQNFQAAVNREIQKSASFNPATPANLSKGKPENKPSHIVLGKGRSH